MDINQIKDWLVPISSFFALITISVGVWKSLSEYRIKLQTEARLSHSAQIEADVRLLKLFTEMMEIAHSRRGAAISEKVIEKMFDQGILTKDDFNDLKVLNKRIATAALFNFPIGGSAQDAAVAAIATLAQRHDVLRKPAIEGLKSLGKWLPVAQRYAVELSNL